MRAKKWTRKDERNEAEEAKEVDTEERAQMRQEVNRIRIKAMQNIARLKAAPPELNLKPVHLEDLYTDIHNLAVILRTFSTIGGSTTV